MCIAFGKRGLKKQVLFPLFISGSCIHKSIREPVKAYLYVIGLSRILPLYFIYTYYLSIYTIIIRCTVTPDNNIRQCSMFLFPWEVGGMANSASLTMGQMTDGKHPALL